MTYLYVLVAGVLVGFFGRKKLEKHLSPETVLTNLTNKVFGKKKGGKR